MKCELTYMRVGMCPVHPDEPLLPWDNQETLDILDAEYLRRTRKIHGICITIGALMGFLPGPLISYVTDWWPQGYFEGNRVVEQGWVYALAGCVFVGELIAKFLCRNMKPLRRVEVANAQED